jgi:hypothetical protein
VSDWLRALADPADPWHPDHSPEPVTSPENASQDAIPWERIINAADILHMTGWKTRQSVAHAIDKRGFPPADWTLTGGQRLWDCRPVQEWIETHMTKIED